jgi:hypothetical protein
MDWVKRMAEPEPSQADELQELGNMVESYRAEKEAILNAIQESVTQMAPEEKKQALKRFSDIRERWKQMEQVLEEIETHARSVAAASAVTCPPAADQPPSQATQSCDAQTTCPPPCPPTSQTLLAVGSTCCGELSVRVFAYPDGSTPQGAYEPGYQLLPGVVVQLTGNTAHSSRTTECEGTATWNCLDSGSYSVSIANLPPGYCQDAKEITVDIENGKTKECDIGLVPEPATIAVTTTLQDSCQKAPVSTIGNVPIEFYRNGKRFHCCETNPETGLANVKIDRPGLIEVAPRPRLHLKGQRHVRLAQKARILVQADPGSLIPVEAVYVSVPAEIQVAAYLARPAHGKQGHSKSHTTFIPGVTFTLRRPETDFVQQFTTTEEQLIACFPDLDASGGEYTLQASMASGPLIYEGQTYELDPCIKSVNVGPGQAMQIFDQFGFRLQTTRVTGAIFDETCARGLQSARITLTALQGRIPPQTVTIDDKGVFFADLQPGAYKAEVDPLSLRFAHGRTVSPVAVLEQDFVVTAGNTTPTLTFRLTPQDEEHAVQGQVTDDEGSPYPYAVVEVLNNQLRFVTQGVADGQGNYLIPLDASGSFYLRLQGERDLVQVQVNSIPTVNLRSRRRRTDVTGPML